MPEGIAGWFNGAAPHRTSALAPSHNPRRMRCDSVHQRRRQAVVRLKAKLLETRAHGVHLLRISSRLDDRGHKGCELRRRPALVTRAFGVDEIQAIERMVLVLYAAIHVDA